jgi:renalase
MSHRVRVAVIGAGVAGLAAGSELQRTGFDVVVYEKSRGLGGRVATRRVADCCFDHGAQVLKTADPRIEALVIETGNAVRIAEPVWAFDQTGCIAEGDPLMNAEPKWTWPAGITTFAGYLGRDLLIHRSTLVHRLVYNPSANPHYTLLAEDDTILGFADAVVLTPPAAQTAAILAASDMSDSLRTPRIAALDRVTYRRCLTFTCAFPTPIERPWYALVNTDRLHPISWLAREEVKPGRTPAGTSLLIVQMSDAWSLRYWDQTARGIFDTQLPASVNSVLDQMHALLDEQLPSPAWIDVQRWRYSLPYTEASVDELHLDDNLYFAGDFLVGQGRIHLAIASGWQVADRIRAVFA